MSQNTQHIFVVGPDEHHWEALQTVAEGDADLRFHSLLEKDQVVHFEDLEVEAVLQEAEKLLEGEAVHAIIAQWDFPTTLMVPLLCKERGLRSPSLEAVIRCSHKYWSRVAQQQSIPAVTPRFALIDPFENGVADTVDLPRPYWIKPVKGFGSMLGFRIDSDDDLTQALEAARSEVERVGEPFDALLEEAGIDRDLRSVSGQMLLAEEYLEGIEVAHEGYVQGGQVHFHGSLEMVREGETFTRFLWPASVPSPVLQRMAEASTTFLEHIAYDDGCFNAEYFWNPETDALRIVEVNPRISQSHVPLAELHDGRSNHQVAIDVSLGRRPKYRPGAGAYAVTAKFLERTEKDGTVKRLPTEAELEALKDDFPSATIVFLAEEGDRLSELVDQDAYTHKFMEIYMGARDRDELLERHAALLDRLPLEIEGVDLATDLVGNRPRRS